MVIGTAALLASAAVAGCADADSAPTSLAAAAATRVALGSGPATALQAQYEAVIKAVLPSVVQINTADAQGSGVVYDDKGDIVTNAHVVGSATTVQVTSDVGGGATTATVLGVDSSDDLAVVRVTTGGASLRPATFGPSASAVAGQIVLALGSPLGLTGTATQGIISATGRTLIETNATDSGAVKALTIAGTLQTTAAINSGNSGGALVNLADQVIGLPTAAALNAGSGDSTGIGFAIPADTVTRVARQLIAAGHVSARARATLGLTARSAAASPGHPAGATIASVSADGPAASAGLRAGDVITSVDGSAIQGDAQLAALLSALRPGMRIGLRYTRSGVTRIADVTLGVAWG